MNDLNPRIGDKLDLRRFGVGERVDSQPYTQAGFEKTLALMHGRKLFDAAPDAAVAREKAVSN